MKGSTNRGQDVQPVSNSVDADAHALTVAITRGDREALGQLFDRYYTMMLNECRKSSGTNSILAEDAAQEAWLQAQSEVLLSHPVVMCMLRLLCENTAL